MHVLLEYIPLIAFFAVYKLVDIFWATAVLIGLSALQLGYGYFKDGKIATRHLVMFSIALVLGSLTILFHDEQFIKSAKARSATPSLGQNQCILDGFTFLCRSA
jgi:intracellular septation protein